MKKVIIGISSSHAWLWLQTCVTSLFKNPPRAKDCDVEIVVVDNSPWAPAMLGITATSILYDLPSDVKFSVIPNHKTNRFHASGLDCIVETMDFDYLMGWETDVLALRPTWMSWFMDQMKPTDFAVGMWHHENFVNPSCTLYRGDVLRKMNDWCKTQAPQDELRWGENFSLTAPLDNNLHNAENPAEVLKNMKGWIGGPFAEKRGFPQGTILKDPWSGQLKGPGWFEPGQQLHHWATNEGHTYTVCPTETVLKEAGMPISTFYGPARGIPNRQMEFIEMAGIAETVHLWGGTRALDIIKHPVTCGFVAGNTPFWLQREARFWKDSVNPTVQKETIDLIRKHGFHYRGQGTEEVTERDRESVRTVLKHYADGGVEI